MACLFVYIKPMSRRYLKYLYVRTAFYYMNEKLGSIELELDQENAKADKCRYLSFSILLQTDHSEVFIARPAA